MASKMHSARYETTTASCGHDTIFFVPPGNIGVVGRRNMVEAQNKPCPKCRKASEEVESGQARDLGSDLAQPARQEKNPFLGATFGL